MADTKTSDADVRRMIALAHDAIIVGNAIDDPTYRPYCLACTGKVRMTKVEPFLWRHGCGAEHDERQVLAAITPPPRLVPDRPSQFDGFSAANVVRMLDEWAADQREREAWNDGDKSTYTFRAGLLQTAANRLREAAAPPAEAPAERGDEFPQDVAEALDVLETMEGDIDGHTDCTATVIRYMRSLTPRVTGGRECRVCGKSLHDCIGHVDQEPQAATGGEG